MFHNRKISIAHPSADTISISVDGGAYSGDLTSEIAFFLHDDWVVKPLTEFAGYFVGRSGNTAVYGWVPNWLIEAFVERYRDN